jgi:hypothetical protein
MIPMRNFILAITSFIATVVLLSQVALAEEDWDAKHTTSAQGEEPIQNTAAGRASDPKMAEGSSPDSGEDNKNPCKTCAQHRAPVKRLGDRTIVDKVGSDDGGTSGSKGQKGEK